MSIETLEAVNSINTATPYHAALFLHDVWMGRNQAVDVTAIKTDPLNGPKQVHSQSGTEMLFVEGEIDGRKAYQSLSKSPRTGNLYFTTVFCEPGGEVLRARMPFESTHDDPLAVQRLKDSLFARHLELLAQFDLV